MCGKATVVTVVCWDYRTRFKLNKLSLVCGKATVVITSAAGTIELGLS